MTDDRSQKNRRLVDRLLEQTRAGRLTWEPGVDSQTFLHQSDPGYLFITRSSFEEDERVGVHFQLDICNEEGHPVESMDGDYPVHREEGPLVELYEEARRVARDAETVVDEWLEVLGAS